MKTIEFDERLPAWLNNLLNRAPFCIDADRCRTVFGWVSDNEGLKRATDADSSLYLNGVWFIRVLLPFGVFVAVKPCVHGNVYQAGIGWKGNGRFTVTARRQDYWESARGVQGPNAGHAYGWDRGNA